MYPTGWKYLLLLCAILVVYGKTLTYDFVNYDDPDLVYQNEAFLADGSNVFTAFTTHAFTSHRNESVYYRPILLVSYILDYQLWKLSPFGYHASNILLHLAATLALFALLKRLLRNELGALGGALLFALHPIQTESVAWVAGRNDVLLGLFIILMMLFHTMSFKEDGSRKKMYVGLSAFAFLVALLTKESAAFYILLIPLYDIVVRNSSLQYCTSREARLSYLLSGIVLLVYLGIRLMIFGELVGAERLYGIIPMADRVLQIPAMAAEHLRMLLLPSNLSIVHPLDELAWFRMPWNILAYAILLLALAAIWWVWRRDTMIAFGLLWMSAGFLPLLNVIPVAVPILEHRLYAVLPGLALIFGRGMILVQISEVRKQVLLSVFMVLLAVMAFARTSVWQNSESLWLDAIAKAPTGSRSYFNLAGFYFDSRRYDKTVEYLESYIRLKPVDAFALSKLRESYFYLGRYPEASDMCRRLILLTPGNQDRYIEAGMLFERLGMPDSAFSVYDQGLRFDSTFYKVHLQLGTLFEETRNPTKAASSYRDAIRYSPQFGPAYFRLGRLLTSEQDTMGGIQLIEEGMKRWRPPPEVISFLKELYEKTNQPERAAKLTRK